MIEEEKLSEIYRGHEIILTREQCLGGWEMLYYSIYRESDGYECACSFTEDDSDLHTYMKSMREWIDAELASGDPWDEKADQL